MRNQLVGINGFNSTSTCEALTASFKYDALGRRIEKTINGRAIQYLYDGQDIVQEIENNQVAVNYLRTLNIDEPLARIESSGVVRYYQQDALGSVIALSDETGSIKTQYIYDPFGKVEIIGEASDNPFQYTGRENDGTGVYYYRARYYSPELQRFISEDPIGLAGGDVNFYGYVGNNPINLFDPEGKSANVVAKIIAEIIGVAYITWEGFKELCKGIKASLEEYEKIKKVDECSVGKSQPLAPWQEKIWKACQWINRHIWPILH